MSDAHMPNLPMAKQKRRYKDPHWFPTVWKLRDVPLQ